MFSSIALSEPRYGFVVYKCLLSTVAYMGAAYVIRLKHYNKEGN
jgi:hypothetical protein